MNNERITEADVLDPEREAYVHSGTCIECGTQEPLAMMVDVRGDEGLCQACEHQFAEEDEANRRDLNRYLDGLIAQSMRGYR